VSRIIPKEYFENRIEQSNIKLALWDACPVDVQYFNLIIALTEMLKRAVEEAYTEDVYTKKTITKGGYKRAKGVLHE
jgi:hypothetical protein